MPDARCARMPDAGYGCSERFQPAPGSGIRHLPQWHLGHAAVTEIRFPSVADAGCSLRSDAGCRLRMLRAFSTGIRDLASGICLMASWTRCRDGDPVPFGRGCRMLAALGCRMPVTDAPSVFNRHPGSGIRHLLNGILDTLP